MNRSSTKQGQQIRRPSSDVVSGSISLRHGSEEITGYADGPRRWFHVRLYPDVAPLRVASHRYHAEVDHRTCEAIVQSWRPPSTRSGHAGVIRLARGHHGADIVAHEALHVAMIVFRQDVQTGGGVALGSGCGPAEEALAYLVGDAVWALNDWLHRVGAYDT